MIYFYLALLATLFGLLGFLVHKFCFSDGAGNEARPRIEKLEQLLLEKQTEVRLAQEEIAKKSAAVQSLEQQIRQRNEEMEKLRQTAARQDQEIASIQREAAEIRAAFGTATPLKAVEAPAKAERNVPAHGLKPAPSTADRTRDAVQEAKAGREPENAKPRVEGSPPPPWRENLNNIIDILDAMEKEIEK